MTPTLSVYLDLVRILAAIVVVLSHVWPIVLPHELLPWPGHDAVVVFFVLSGLVIAHTTSRPNRSLADYIQHRLARIYSVGLPAILLSAALTPFTMAISVSGAAPAPAGYADLWSRSLANFFAVAECWRNDIAMPLNAPFWSLNYEIWYYFIFGIWTYGPTNGRFPLTILVACAAGPKILLLLPAWLCGVLLYRWQPEIRIDRARLLFIGSIVAGASYFWFDIGVRIRVLMLSEWPTFMAHIGGSNEFVGDNILALIVLANFASVSSLGGGPAKLLLSCQAGIRAGASYTLSTYLYHMPLFVLLWTVLGIHKFWLIAPLLSAGIIMTGFITERRAEVWRSFIRRLPIWGWADVPSVFHRRRPAPVGTPLP